MALFFDDSDEDATPAEEGTPREVLKLFVCRALTGELFEEVEMCPSDTVLDLEEQLARTADLECLPRLLHDGVPLRAHDTLSEAGLHSGDRVLAVVCPYQAIATTSHDHTARVWNAATGECQRILEGHTNYVHSVSFAPDGRFVVTGSHDRTARIWRLSTGQVHKILEGHHSYVKVVCYSPDGQSIVTGSGDCTAMVWEPEAGVPRSWDVPEGDHRRKRWTLQGHMSSVNSASFAPCGRLLVTGSEDRTAKVWDLHTGLEVLTLKGHSSSTYACFAPNGRQIATASDDKSAKLWDAETGECVRTFGGHAKFVRCISWAPDSRHFVTGSGDATAKIWSVESGQCTRSLTGHTSFVYSVAFSPDGQTLVTGSADGTARIWDAETGGCEQVLEGHKKQVYSAVFGPDRTKCGEGAEKATCRGRASEARLRSVFRCSSSPVPCSN